MVKNSALRILDRIFADTAVLFHPVVHTLHRHGLSSGLSQVGRRHGLSLQ